MMHITTQKVCTYTIHDSFVPRSGSFADVTEIEQIILDMDGSQPQLLSVDLKKRAVDKDAKSEQNKIDFLVNLQSGAPEILKEEITKNLNLVICDKLLYPADVQNIIKQQYDLYFEIGKYNPNIPVRHFSVRKRTQPGLRIGDRPTTQTFYDVSFEQVKPTDTVVDRNLNYLYGKKCDVRKVITGMLAQTKTKGS